MLDYNDKEKFLRIIVEAINEQKLIIFVGSGVSKLCGFPLWGELARLLLEECAKDKKCEFTYQEINAILDQIKDERELISIAKNAFKEVYGSDRKFYSLLTKKLRAKKKISNKAEKIRSLILSLSKTIITTNADDFLDQDIDPDNVIYDIRKFSFNEPNRIHKIYHIHGSVKKDESLVFTTADYLVRYADENFKKSVSSLFSDADDHVILFVGYGFREMQLLDFLVNGQRERKLSKYFFLNGYFENQESIFAAEEKYYQAYGLTLVAYYKNEQNYDGLIKALEHIGEIASAASKKIRAENAEIYRIVQAGPTADSLSEIKYEYRNFWSLVQKHYFVSQILKSNQAQNWANALIEDSGTRKKVFSLECLSDIKEDDRDVLLGDLLLLLIEGSCSDRSFDFYKDFISELVGACLEDKKLVLNHRLSFLFFTLIFSNKPVLAWDPTKDYLNEYVDISSDPDYWMSVAEQSQSLFGQSDEVLRYLLELSFSKVDDIHSISFWRLSFFKRYYWLFCTRIGKQVFDAVFPLAQQQFKTVRYTYNVFDEALKDEGNAIQFFIYLQKWLACTIRCLDIELVKTLYAEKIGEHQDFSTLVSIYMANVHFSDIGLNFVEVVPDLATNRIFYSEIYSLVKNNIANLTKDQILTLKGFISQIDYKSKQATSISKYCLIELLETCPAASGIDFSDLDVDSEIIAAYKSESDSERIGPLDMSKSARIIAGLSDEEDIVKKNGLLEKSLDDFLKWVRDPKNPTWMIESLSYDFEKLNKKFKFFENIGEDRLQGLPDSFLNIIQNKVAIESLSIENKTQLIFEIEHSKEGHSDNRPFLRALYLSIDNGQEIPVDVKQKIFAAVKKIELNDESKLPPSYFPYSMLINDEEFLKYWLLIRTCSDQNYSGLISDLEAEIQKNRHFAIAAAAANVHLLWSYDKKWTRNNMRAIFNNEYENDNLSFSAFCGSFFYESQFVQCLLKNNILGKLLLSKEFDYCAPKYGCVLMMNFLHSRSGERIIRLLASTDFYYECLVILTNHLNKVGSFDVVKTRFFEMMSIIEENVSDKDKLCDCGILLLRFLEPKDINQQIEKFIDSAFSYKNRNWLIKPLIELLSTKKFSPEFSDRIIYAFLSHLSDNYMRPADVKDLVELISDADIKEKTINSLANYRPDLSLGL